MNLPTALFIFIYISWLLNHMTFVITISWKHFAQSHQKLCECWHFYLWLSAFTFLLCLSTWLHKMCSLNIYHIHVPLYSTMTSLKRVSATNLHREHNKCSGQSNSIFPSQCKASFHSTMLRMTNLIYFFFRYGNKVVVHSIQYTICWTDQVIGHVMATIRNLSLSRF